MIFLRFRIENRISSFNVWIKDAETVVLEWTLISNSATILKLEVTENNISMPILELNQTENYFLLEKLKSSTNYSFCLQIDIQIECRQITTKTRQIVSLSSKTIETTTNSSTIFFDIEYLIIAICLSIFSCFDYSFLSHWISRQTTTQITCIIQSYIDRFVLSNNRFRNNTNRHL